MANKSPASAGPDRSAVLPLVIGPKNAEAAVGFSWRWCRDTAAELGVRFVGHGRKRGIVAAEFVEALGRSQQRETDGGPDNIRSSDPAEVVRRRLGIRRVA